MRSSLHQRWADTFERAEVRYQYEPITFDLKDLSLWPGAGLEKLTPTFYLPTAERFVHVIPPQTSSKRYDPILYAMSALAPHTWRKGHRFTLIIGEPPTKLPFVTVTYMKGMPEPAEISPEDLEKSYISFGSRPQPFANKQIVSPSAGDEGAVLLGYSDGLLEEDEIENLPQEQLIKHGLLATPWVPSTKLLKELQKGVSIV